MVMGVIFLIIGFGGLLQSLGYISTDLELFWPLIFIGLGFSIMLGHKNGHGCYENFFNNKKKK